MAVDTLIIRDLPRLEWAGLPTPPYTTVSFEFKNRLAPREVAYVDASVHDDTGRESFPMTARLLFVNGLFNTTGTRLFPELWERWKATFDGAPRDLRHPVLGPLRARVDSVKGVLDPQNTGGVVVDVAWVETLEDPALPSYLGVLELDPSTLAQKADDAAAAYGVEVPDGFPYGGLSEAMDAARELSFSLDPTAALVLGAILLAVGAMLLLLDLGNNPERIFAHDTLLGFWVVVKRMRDSARAAARPTAREVVKSDTSLATWAASKGNDLFEVMALNPGALRQPIVKRGTTLTYFVNA